MKSLFSLGNRTRSANEVFFHSIQRLDRRLKLVFNFIFNFKTKTEPVSTVTNRRLKKKKSSVIALLQLKMYGALHSTEPPAPFVLCHN